MMVVMVVMVVGIGGVRSDGVVVMVMAMVMDVMVMNRWR